MCFFHSSLQSPLSESQTQSHSLKVASSQPSPLFLYHGAELTGQTAYPLGISNWQFWRFCSKQPVSRTPDNQQELKPRSA